MRGPSAARIFAPRPFRWKGPVRVLAASPSLITAEIDFREVTFVTKRCASKNILKISLACLLLGAATTASAQSGELAIAEPRLTFGSGFETGKLTQGVYWSISGNAPVVQSELSRDGRYAMRTTLDRYASDVSYRTEVKPLAPNPVMGQDTWYGVSVYLPTGYVPDDIWEIVFQWHGVADEGEPSLNPPLAMFTNGGKWSLANKWDAQRISSRDSYDGTKKFDFGPYATGRWTDWVFHIRWSYLDDGLIEVWKDGKSVAKTTGPNTFNDARMPYFKMGLYKGWKEGRPAGSVTRRELYHDDFRMAYGPEASYEDVAPGPKRARPVPPKLTLGR